ncbi:MAG: 2-hydroxyacid dehydrogenase [Promethearchaeota archaeon]
MAYLPKVYFTSKVFTVEKIGSNEKISKNIRDVIKNLWQKLNEAAEFKIFNGRNPTKDQLQNEISNFTPHIIGCHLAHPITAEMLESSPVFAIATSTAGYNHIERTEKDDIIITHTPGVLYDTVADYTIALIMANLRNLIDLHISVWNGEWTAKSKWDLDQTLSSVVTNKILGIVGLGEIGKEVVKKLYPWGVKIIYYDVKRMKDFEKEFPLLEFKENLEDIFQEADIVSLHIPLNKYTENVIDRNLLKLMKKNALLVNTARGAIIDFDALLDLLEKKEIQINLAFDVFPIEPLDAKTLKRLKAIKKNQPEIRMILISHNASADANTRAKMVILFLEDIIKLLESNSIEDLKNIHIIPEHRNQLVEREWRILNYWKNKK